MQNSLEMAMLRAPATTEHVDVAEPLLAFESRNRLYSTRESENGRIGAPQATAKLAGEWRDHAPAARRPGGRSWPNARCDKCVHFCTAPAKSPVYHFGPMATTNRAEFKRVILKIERDLFAQAHLRTLLTALDQVLADDQKELKAIKTRIRQARHLATASGRRADRETAAHAQRGTGRRDS